MAEINAVYGDGEWVSLFIFLSINNARFIISID